MAKLQHQQLIYDMINNGYITVKKHPDADLYIYNYSSKASVEHVWNEATEYCRGIICDKDLNIVARAFPKFFNYEELIQNGVEIPKLPFEVYEKLDGSLGILYFKDNEPFIATRGSFNSDQAIHANKILYTKYKDVLHKLNRDYTYLFEIIIPHGADSNLVVNYGDLDDIILLAVIVTETGEELDIEQFKDIFTTAEKYDNVTDFLKFRDTSNGNNREGFVVKFANGFRLKLKFEEYFKAHFAKSFLSYNKILNAVKCNEVDQLRNHIEANLPEEDLIYFNEIVNSILEKYKSIINICKSEYRDDFNSRAEAAAYFKQCKFPAVMFAIYDCKEYRPIVWKYV